MTKTFSSFYLIEQEKDKAERSAGKAEKADEAEGQALADGSPDAERVQADREEKFGKVLRRSGVAITVTSLTDFLAFAVGGTTVSCGIGSKT